MSLASVQYSNSTTTTTSSDQSSSGSAFLRHQTGINDSDLPFEPSQQHLFRFGEDKEFLVFPRFSEEEIKKALKAEAEKHAMWKTAAVKRMKIVNIDTSVAFRYTLETFTETRSTFDVSERFPDNVLGAKHTSALIAVWDMECHPTRMFMDETQEIEMPGTTYLIKCETCNGQVDSHCYTCRGAGSTKCTICNSTGMRTGIPHPLIGPRAPFGKSNNSNNQKSAGYPSMTAISAAGLTHMDLCHVCQGRGFRQCTQCKGAGKKTCGVCDGCGQMRKYTKLKIRYEVDKSEYVHECGLPDDIIGRVTGEIIFNETRPQVYPMKNFPIEVLNDQSRFLVQGQRNKHTGAARILQQRHQLEAIPVAAVVYDLNGHKGTCWVVGLERLAYIPNYPKKCSIL